VAPDHNGPAKLRAIPPSRDEQPNDIDVQAHDRASLSGVKTIVEPAFNCALIPASVNEFFRAMFDLPGSFG
jgi:hypothetical protein